MYEYYFFFQANQLTEYFDRRIIASIALETIKKKLGDYIQKSTLVIFLPRQMYCQREKACARGIRYYSV